MSCIPGKDFFSKFEILHYSVGDWPRRDRLQNSEPPDTAGEAHTATIKPVSEQEKATRLPGQSQAIDPSAGWLAGWLSQFL